MTRIATIDSLFKIHATRVGCALFLASLAALFLPLDHGVWIPMTVLFVLGTTVGATVRKCIHRFWGTLVGLVAGTLIADFIPHLTFQGIASIFFLFLAYYFRAFAFYNYGLFVIPVTVTIVVTHSIFIPSDSLHLLTARIVNTLLGLAITLLVSFLVAPRRTQGRIESSWDPIAQLMGDYYKAITSRSGAKEAKETLERALINHRLLYYEARYERAEWAGCHNYLEKMEEGISLLFALHNALREPLDRSFADKTHPYFRIVNSQCEALLRRDSWSREALFDSLDKISASAQTVTHKVIASRLNRFATLLIHLNSICSRAN